MSRLVGHRRTERTRIEQRSSKRSQAIAFRVNDYLALVFHNLPVNRAVRGATERILQRALILLHHAINDDSIRGTFHVVFFPGGLIARDGASYDAYLCSPGSPSWRAVEKWIDGEEPVIALSGKAIVTNAKAYGEYGAILNLAE